MFRFVVRRLRWLAQVPLAPQVFDALLLAWTAIFQRQCLHAMEALEDAVRRWPGVTRCVHRFGGIGFVRCGREFAHLHGNGLLDVQLSRERASARVAEGSAEPHHALGESSWVSCWLRSADDLERGLALVEEGAALAAGLAPEPVGSGAQQLSQVHVETRDCGRG